MRCLILCVLGLTTPAIAQGPIVFPTGYASKRANGFGYEFYQSVMGTRQMPFVEQVFFEAGSRVVGKFRGMGFRPMPGWNGQPGDAAPAFGVDLELLMGSSPHPLGNEHVRLEENRAGDFVPVTRRRIVRFPAISPFRSSAVQPFDFRIPFDSPVTLPRAANLMWELRAYSSTLSLPRTVQGIRANGGAFTAGVISAPSMKKPTYAVKYFGTSCPNPWDNWLHILDPFSVGARTGIAKHPQAALPGNRYAVAFLGSSSKSWGKLRLPYDLSSLGAPGCHVYISWDVMVAPLLYETEHDIGWWTLRIPNRPQLVGATVFVQVVAINAHNALRLGTSNAASARIGPARRAGISIIVTKLGAGVEHGFGSSWGGPIFALIR